MRGTRCTYQQYEEIEDWLIVKVAEELTVRRQKTKPIDFDWKKSQTQIDADVLIQGLVKKFYWLTNEYALSNEYAIEARIPLFWIVALPKGLVARYPDCKELRNNPLPASQTGLPQKKRYEDPQKPLPSSLMSKASSPKRTKPPQMHRCKLQLFNRPPGVERRSAIATMKDFIEEGSWFDESGGFRITEVTLSKLWEIIKKERWLQSEATRQRIYVDDNTDQHLLNSNESLQDALLIMHRKRLRKLLTLK